jgi:hypothetical protein
MVGRAPSSKCHNTSLYITSRIDSLTICNLLYIPLQRCHDPANGRKCKNEQFRKCGPANLESMHIMLRSAHVTGATASTPRDLSDNPSDDEVYELEENPSDVMLSSLQKKGKKCKAPSSHGIKDKEERRSPFLRLYKNTCSKIQGVDKLTSKVLKLPQLSYNTPCYGKLNQVT